jgi:DNA-binding IclR family transcriptional regulator
MSANSADEPSVPFERTEEFRLLRMLHNIGATKPEKSLSIHEILDWTGMETSTIETELQKLVEQGFVQPKESEGTNKYHVTLSGMRKVLSMYS